MLTGEVENVFCLTYMTLPMHKYEEDFVKINTYFFNNSIWMCSLLAT